MIKEPKLATNTQEVTKSPRQVTWVLFEVGLEIVPVIARSSLGCLVVLVFHVVRK